MEHKIECPRCHHEFDVSEVISHQVEENLKAQYDQKINDAMSQLTKEKESVEKLKAEQEQIIKAKIESELSSEKRKLEAEIQKKIREEESSRLELIQKELSEKSEQLKEFHKNSAELEKIKRQLQEVSLKAEADAEKRLNEKLNEERERITKLEQERNELKIKELQKKLEDQMELTEQMKRKQEQGSMQLQGEVQELAIEEWLMQNFPLDEIVEIKKGQRGGDCLQVIHTNTRQNCGKIYYESKRTKDFHQSWIQKFKDDIQAEGADIGVLITSTMPAGMERMGIYQGIWVCTFEEFKALCFVLRDSILRVNQAMLSQENKGDKMQMLYEYLTGNQFRLQIEAIVEAFKSMQDGLNKEKVAMNKIWKEREKQIEKVMMNTVDLYGSVKGIAGAAVQEIPQLSLPEYEEEN